MASNKLKETVTEKTKAIYADLRGLQNGGDHCWREDC